MMLAFARDSEPFWEYMAKLAENLKNSECARTADYHLLLYLYFNFL